MMGALKFRRYNPTTTTKLAFGGHHHIIENQILSKGEIPWYQQGGY